MTITIDGPAGSGKSTTARLLASRLGFTYLDTGAMYRAVTFLALQRNIELSSENALARLAKETDLKIVSTKNGSRVWADSREITSEIRSAEVTKNVSIVASHAAVRSEMVGRQREIASKGNCIVEGRDIGSVVFPNAELKIYMNASIEARAQRRRQELEKKGIETDFATIKSQIIARDDYDSGREIAPLTIPADAVVIDTTELTIDGQIERIIEAYNEFKE